MNTPIALNVGLSIGREEYPANRALKLLLPLGAILAARVVDSPAGNEKALTVSILPHTPEETFLIGLEKVATNLLQDCIAWHDGARGGLAGPNAEAWGQFNPAFFVDPITGQTLAEKTPPVDEWQATLERVKARLRDILQANEWKPGSAKARAAEYALTHGAEAVLGKEIPFFQICRLSGRSILD